MTSCARETCPWQSGYDGKCRWPTDNCPWKAEREQAERRQQEIARQAAACRDRLRRRYGRTRPQGVYRTGQGRWAAVIRVGSKGRANYREYRLGVYDTREQAETVRRLAELHRALGELEPWVGRLQKQHSDR